MKSYQLVTFIYDRKKSIASATDTLFTQQQVFPNARTWNAETPNTYTLVVSTFDAQGKPQRIMGRASRWFTCWRNLQMRAYMGQ